MNPVQNSTTDRMVTSFKVVYWAVIAVWTTVLFSGNMTGTLSNAFAASALITVVAWHALKAKRKAATDKAIMEEEEETWTL